MLPVVVPYMVLSKLPLKEDLFDASHYSYQINKMVEMYCNYASFNLNIIADF